MTERELSRMYRYVFARLEFLAARVRALDPALRLRLEREWEAKCQSTLPPLDGGPWAGDTLSGESGCGPAPICPPSSAAGPARRRLTARVRIRE